MRLQWIALCLLSPLVCFAQSPQSLAPPEPVAAVDGAPVRDLDTVVVTGAQPGPGMWKVSKGDHVLWILGTTSLLPAGMQWKSDEVRAVLDQADQVLASPGVSISPDVGLFRGLLLLPSMKKAMNNPEGKTLRDVLPADTYTRWIAMKQRYIGRDAGIEKKRPFLVAQQLYAAAIKQAGLGGKVISPVIDPVLKRRDMEYTRTRLMFKIEDPKAAIADFRKESLQAKEVACMNETMDGIERDMPQMVARANAWAVGDLEKLRALSANERKSCWAAWADSDTLQKRGVRDVEAQIRARWLEVAEAALAKNRVTFATLQMSYLLPVDGYLASLQAKGYAVEAPE